MDMDDIIGGPLRDNYRFAVADQFRGLGTLSGRNRYRLVDTSTNYQIELHFFVNDNQLWAFRQVWANNLQHGTLPFYIGLTLGGALLRCLVQPTKEYSITFEDSKFWHIQMTVELDQTNATPYPPPVDCDVIYGGPIWSLATDIIESTIDAPDVIEPCPGVLP